jgi:Zn-dependent peptidase ImmA (M78 family)
MIENHIVRARSSAEIETLACDWRRSLAIEDQWAPNLLEIFNSKLPSLFPGFQLVCQPDEILGTADAFTRHPRIFVRQSVVDQPRNWKGRARFTLCHELGHLLLHPEAPSPRMATRNKPAPIDDFRKSAEWQANKFAAFFLMPEFIVRQFASAEEVSEHCKVSIEAARNRFKEVGHFKPPLSPIFLNFLDEWKKKYK